MNSIYGLLTSFFVLFGSVVFLGNNCVQAQERDHLGREFFLCFPPNFHQNAGQNTPNDSLYICITSEKECRGRIEYRDRDGREFVRTFEFAPPVRRHVESFAYTDFEIQGDNLGGLLNNPDSQNESKIAQVFRVVISSTPEVSVSGLNHAAASSDGFMALPVDALDGFYIVPSLPSDARVIENRLSAASTPSQIAIIALENNTEVQIQPAAPLPVAGIRSLRVNLQRGEAYFLQTRMSVSETGNDLTGTVIISDEPLAVFTGHQRTQIPRRDDQNRGTQDHIIEQVAPASTWGKEVVVTPLADAPDDDGSGSDLAQIVASSPQTRLRINGVDRAILQIGETYWTDVTEALHIQADAPIQVTHLRHSSSLVGSSLPLLGDPFALAMTPREQWLSRYVFSTAQAFDNPDRADRRTFTLQYLQLVLPAQSISELRLNGESLDPQAFQQTDSEDLVFANIFLEDGTHIVESDVPFAAHVYGYGIADSYAYPAGAAFLPINLECKADAGPAITVCRGDTVTLSAIASGFGEATRYRWSPDEFLITSPFARQLRFVAVESAWYKVNVSDERDCRAEDSVYVTVTPRPSVDAGADLTICEGESIQLGIKDLEEPISSISWTPADKVDDPTIAAPVASPEEATGFVVEVETLSGCVVHDTVVVNVRKRPSVDAGEDVSICRTGSTELLASGGIEYRWRPVDDLSDPNIFNPIARPMQTRTYYVRVTDEFGCVNQDSVTVVVEDCEPCVEISGVINDYTSVISLDKATQRVRVVDATAFSPGDLAMIVQMQGAEIRSDQSAQYGRIESIGTAGSHELVRIASISLNLLSLDGPIKNNYDDAGKIQLVRVPEYDHVTVTDNLLARPWNGNTGGVIALVANCLMVEDTVSADGAGFRGGAYINQSGCRFEPNTTDWVSDQLCRFSPRGEGLAGYGAGQLIYGRGAPANGGGGGNNHNAGGGGGANGAAGGNGGNGFRNFANWGEAGGVGGRNLAQFAKIDSTGRLFMGGGGGAGHVNHQNGSGGANGGGIVYIRCGTLRTTPNALFSARGMHAQNDEAELNPDGCGGGGAGGTIMLHAEKLFEDVNLDVRGGKGGSILRDLEVTAGPGGGGAGGFVLLSDKLQESQTSIFSSLNGGEAGELGLASGNNYGAESGGPGLRVTDLKVYDALSGRTYAACEGCYPVRKAHVGGCGEVRFNAADANFEIIEVSLTESSRNVSLEFGELNSLRVPVTLALTDPNRSGDYELRVLNTMGKESIFRGNILPRPPIPRLTFRNDSLFIVREQLPGLDSIQWYSRERGALAQQVRDGLALVDSGTYWVEIWNEFGCSSMSEPFNFKVVSSVTDLPNHDARLDVYPNPAHDRLSIKFRSNSAESLRLQISDLFGRVVFTRELAAFQFSHSLDIDLNRIEMAPAAYVVSVIGPGLYQSAVFIKQP